MNKKILIGSIIAVTVLIGVSFTSVVGYRSVESNVKASPLFNIRSSRAVEKDSKVLSNDYVGKGEEIGIPVQKRDNRTELIQEFFDTTSKMDEKTFNLLVSIAINRIINKNYAKENKIPDLKYALYQFKSNPEMLKFKYNNKNLWALSPLTGCSTCQCSPPTKLQCLLLYIIQFLASLFFQLVELIKDILNIFTIRNLY